MEEEIVKEFLIESYEILDGLDNDLVVLEQEGGDPELLNRIFRGVHTIKGTGGFLSFTKLVSVAHTGEELLDDLRAGALAPSEELTSVLLHLVDAIREMLTAIEGTGEENETDYSDLVERMERLQEGGEAAATTEEASAEEALSEETAAQDEPPASQSAPAATEATLSAPEQTLRALRQAHDASGQPVALEALAEARDLAEGTIRNHLTTLKKDGAVTMLGDGTYRPASSEASPTPGDSPVPEPAAPALPEMQATPEEKAARVPAGIGGARAPDANTPSEKEPQEEAGSTPAASLSGDGAPSAGGNASSSNASESSSSDSKPASGGTASSSLADDTIRVEVSQLDALMNLVGELVLARNQIVQYADSGQDKALASSSQKLDLVTTELQEGVMQTRMQPIENVWSKYPRVVRDVAVACGKEARLEMEGADTELDKTILEAIKDPLTHLVRNAVDHGIETPAAREAAGKPAEGRLLLRAYHEGGQVNIEIIDDGSGIDPDAIAAKALERDLLTKDDLARMSERDVLRQVFAPGFSTAEQVNDISGRGVGMDVVRTNIEQIGGTVDVQSRVGEGTTFKIKIPLTLAIVPALIAQAGGERFAIPQVNLLELVRLAGEEAGSRIEYIHDTPVYRLRGQLLPLVKLSEELELGASDERAATKSNALIIVVLQVEGQHFGLVVDDVMDTEEVVVKPLSKQLKQLGIYAGATIMGDGKIALILDVLGLAQDAGVLAEDGVAQQAAQQEEADAEAEEEKEMLLLLGIGEGRRLAVPSAHVSRLEEIASEQVERSGRQEVIQYRGTLMPLLRLGPMLGEGGRGASAEGDILQVVVCRLHGVNVGLVVDEILDVAEDHVELQQLEQTRGVAGTAVIQERVTELLDVEELVAAAGLAAAAGGDGAAPIPA